MYDLALLVQCYDVASCVTGWKSGIAVRIVELEHKHCNDHCYGLSLNLIAQNSIMHINIMEVLTQ